MAKRKPCKPKPKEPILVHPSIFGRYLLAKMNAQMAALDALEFQANPAQVLTPVHIK